MDGIVARWSRKDGYGFIRPLTGQGPDAEAVFCHATALPRTVDSLPVGARVSFTLVDGKRGPQCAHVRLRTLSGDDISRHADSRRVRRYEDDDL